MLYYWYKHFGIYIYVEHEIDSLVLNNQSLLLIKPIVDRVSENDDLRAGEGVVLGATEGTNEGDSESVGQGIFEADGEWEDVDWQDANEVYMFNVTYLSDGEWDEELQAARDKSKSFCGKFVRNFNIDANRERAIRELENEV